jgi:hypothetical protein
MAAWVYPTTNQLSIVGGIKTPMATGVLKLFKAALVPLLPSVVIGDLTAIEADFSGYAAKTLTTLPAPFVDPVNNGISFQIPTVQWDCANPLTVPNQIFGGWMEDAGGNLLWVWEINNPWQMDATGKSLPLAALLNWFGTWQIYIDIAGVPQ